MHLEHTLPFPLDHGTILSFSTVPFTFRAWRILTVNAVSLRADQKRHDLQYLLNLSFPLTCRHGNDMHASLTGLQLCVPAPSTCIPYAERLDEVKRCRCPPSDRRPIRPDQHGLCSRSAVHIGRSCLISHAAPTHIELHAQGVLRRATPGSIRNSVPSLARRNQVR